MDAAGIGTTTISKLGKDQFVSMEVLVKICKVLDCNIGDIVDYIPDNDIGGDINERKRSKSKD